MTKTGKLGLMVGAATIALISNAMAQSNADLAPRVDALEAEVQQAEMNFAAAANAPPPAAPTGWWNNTSVSGRMYFDTTNIDQKSNGASVGAPNGTNFDVKRFYIGIDHTFDSVFSANVTTDVTYDSTAKAGQLYLKKAYLQAKIDPALTLRVGATDMPWIPYAEGIYGYRYLENTISEVDKMGTSSDWGIHALGTFFDGILNYDVAAINGAGYKVIPSGGGTNRFNTFDYEGRVNIVYDGFNVGIGGYTGKLGVANGVTTYHTAQRLDAIASYNDGNGFRAGVEYFSTNNWKNVTTVAGDSAHGVSAFSSYMFVPMWSVFGRYDETKPSTKLAPTMNDDYYNFGITWTPTKIIDLSLTYKHDSVSHGSFATSNGTIGGSKSGSYDEVGIFGDLQW